jgi:hypothetical protein
MVRATEGRLEDVVREWHVSNGVGNRGSTGCVASTLGQRTGDGCGNGALTQHVFTLAVEGGNRPPTIEPTRVTPDVRDGDRERVCVCARAENDVELRG